MALALFALGFLAFGSAAKAGPLDPIFTYYASEDIEGTLGRPYPPPGGFEGACGLAVDSAKNFYVGDYYRDHVDVFTSEHRYLTQLEAVDPIDGPCGLAIGVGSDAGSLYVNDYHRGVLKFTPSSYPPTADTSYGPGLAIDSAGSTGVAVNPLNGNVYVNDRTYVAVYEPSGAPVEVEGEPLRIGEGSLGDAYGIAVSAAPATAGYVYVPDAASETVKVFDPAVDAVNPIASIDGHEIPVGHFVSLRDAAVAVNPVTGAVYVADDLQPVDFTRPEAAVYAFDSSGAYDGRFRFNIVDARPPGLAAEGGRVYMTSGNTEHAAVLAYPPLAFGSGAFPAPLPPTASAVVPAAASTPIVSAAASEALSTGAAIEPASRAGEATASPSPRPRHRKHRRHARQRHAQRPPTPARRSR
ncbi:MAG TPA: hypothetical protein VN732_03195 [Solirubrobacterales bacterium]|nr:hypothetical protein [Solirubrobacterales bacterium]